MVNPFNYYLRNEMVGGTLDVFINEPTNTHKMWKAFWLHENYKSMLQWNRNIDLGLNNGNI